MRNKYALYILLVGFIFNGFILAINTPLWDDWTLEGFSFGAIAIQFKGNGLYNGGVAHLHYFINLVDGEGVWFSRLLSLVCLLSAPLLLFFTLNQLSFSCTEAFQVAILMISIPLFGNAFGEIVLPYLICLNLFLGAVFFITKFVTSEKPSYLLLAIASSLLFTSFVTNSLLFYSLPVVAIILLYQWLETKRLKRTAAAASLLIVLIGSFFIFKNSYLIPEVGSPYAASNYNSFGLRDLVLDGPIRTVRYLISYPKIFAHDALMVFSDSFNVLLFLGISMISIGWLAAKRSNSVSNISQRKLYIILVVGLLLLVAAVYPYAVVRKFSDSLFSYNERHNLLVPVGMALLLFSILNLILKANGVKYAYAVIIPLFLVIKLNILGYFVVKTNLQQQVINEISDYITHHRLESQSIMFVDTLDSSHRLGYWSFYEYGGMIRSLGLPENKVFVPESLVRKNKSGNLQLGIKGNTSLFLENSNYGISSFDTSNYEVRKYSTTLNLSPDDSYLEQVLTGHPHIDLTISK